MSCAKTAEPIEMPFGLRTQVDPRNHLLDEGFDPPRGRDNFRGMPPSQMHCNSEGVENGRLYKLYTVHTYPCNVLRHVTARYKLSFYYYYYYYYYYYLQTSFGLSSIRVKVFRRYTFAFTRKSSLKRIAQIAAC